MTASGINLSIIVVSGLPRSGTSLAMQMLQAGGIAIMTDKIRTADDSNPNGYYELEAVKQLPQNSSWLKQATGKAVKVISFLLPELPANYHYKVIFIERDLAEILDSQQKMMQRSGISATSENELAAAFTNHLNAIRPWLLDSSHVDVLFLNHSDLVKHPQKAALQIAEFLNLPLKPEVMAAVVNPVLYRSRRH